MAKRSIAITIALISLFILGQINLLMATPAELETQWQNFVENPSAEGAQSFCKAATAAYPEDADYRKLWAEKVDFLSDRIAVADAKSLEAAMLLHSCADKKWVGQLNRVLSSAIGNHPRLFLLVLNKHQNQQDLWDVITYVEPQQSKDSKARLTALQNRAGAIQTVGSGGEYDTVKGKSLDRLNKEIKALSKQ